MQPEQLVTVVIPASNEEACLGACLASVQAQDYRRLQIIVVDGASTDGTCDVVRSRMATDTRIELRRNSRRNIPSSLNMALAAARGRWLVRVDAHSTVEPSYVGLAVELLRRGSWGGVGGRKEAVGVTSAGKAIAAALGSRMGVGNSTYHYGTSAQEVEHVPFGAYPVDLARQMGGWDERLFANEDFEFDYRLRQAGWHLLFDPRLVIRWQCRQSCSALFRQYHRYGRGKVDVARLHPESLRLRHMLPPAFVTYLVAVAAVAPRRPKHAALMVVPYLVPLLAASTVCEDTFDRPRERAWVPVAFVAMHVGWGTGFYRGMGQLLRRAAMTGANGRGDG